jgi:hypothetical protein
VLREYISAAASKLSGRTLQSDLDAWIQWALSEADKIDPLTNGQVELSIAKLGDVDPS